MHEETSIQIKSVCPKSSWAYVATEDGTTKQAYTQFLLPQRRFRANATIGTPMLPHKLLKRWREINEGWHRRKPRMRIESRNRTQAFVKDRAWQKFRPSVKKEIQVLMAVWD
jgi:hypothetical protein